MPKGPRGEKRPADVVGCAVKVAKIATGETEDERYASSGRRKSGRAGAKARVERTSAAERQEIAKKAATKRWKEGGLKMTTEQQTLVARFQAMKANGLKDLKFFFGQVSESTVDDFCEEVNRLYKLVDEGKCTKIDDWGDGVGLPTT